MGEPAATRYCSNCGAQMAADAKFCPACGQATGASSPPPSVEEKPSEEKAAPAPVVVVKAPKRRFGVVRGCLSLIGGFVVLLIVILVAVSHSSSGGGKGKGAKTAVFSVTGSAPSGVDITYGNDSSNYKGSNPPFHASLAVKSDALYYDISAQLQGGGSITCKLVIGNAVAVGHASGGYNICSAQLNKDALNGGWSK